MGVLFNTHIFYLCLCVFVCVGPCIIFNPIPYSHCLLSHTHPHTAHEEAKEKVLQQGREYRAQMEQELRDRDRRENNLNNLNNSNNGNDGDGNGNSVLSAEAARAQKEAQAERDKRLQMEIRRLQSETVRLERDLKIKAEEQRKHVMSAREREEQESHRRQRQLTEHVSESAITRERLAKQCSLLSDQRKVLLEQLDAAQKEVVVYEDGE